jgi:hypothetical protein
MRAYPAAIASLSFFRVMASGKGPSGLRAGGRTPKQSIRRLFN